MSQLPLFRADFQDSNTISSIIFHAENFHDAISYIAIVFGERKVNYNLERLIKL